MRWGDSALLDGMEQLGHSGAEPGCLLKSLQVWLSMAQQYTLLTARLTKDPAQNSVKSANRPSTSITIPENPEKNTNKHEKAMPDHQKPTMRADVVLKLLLELSVNLAKTKQHQTTKNTSIQSNNNRNTDKQLKLSKLTVLPWSSRRTHLTYH
jgi:hypothetical protein